MLMSYKLVWLLVASLAPVSLATPVDIESGGCQPELDLSVLKSHQSPPHPVKFRLPPSFSSEIDDKWVPTPASWFLGTWYFIHSNTEVYHWWRNMQWTLYARPNNSFDHTLHDLTSFQVANKSNPTIYKIYGVDSPLQVGKIPVRDAYDYRPTGIIAPSNNTWQVIGWGYDKKGVAWAALYEDAAATQKTASFDIISRSDQGPEKHTLSMIFAAARGLKNEKLTKLIDAATKLPQDGGRYGTEWPTCNATCMENGYAIFPLPL